MEKNEEFVDHEWNREEERIEREWITGPIEWQEEIQNKKYLLELELDRVEELNLALGIPETKKEFIRRMLKKTMKNFEKKHGFSLDHISSSTWNKLSAEWNKMEKARKEKEDKEEIQELMELLG